MIFLLPIAQMLKNNLSLVIAPGANFALVVLLARYSYLPEDLLYFFVAGFIGMFSLLDGGVAYKFTHAPSARTVYSVCRQISDNVFILIIPIFVGLFFVTKFSPFGLSRKWPDVFFITLLVLFCGFIKVYSDALRALVLRSEKRIFSDQLASFMAVFRLIIAWAMVNHIPYIYTYAAALTIELIINFKVLDFKIVNFFRAIRPRFFCRIRLYRDYVRVNISYLISSNLDRVLSYYVLPGDVYRDFVVLLSIFNMSLLPHKVIENEMTFPSVADGKRGNSSKLMISLMLASCGSFALGCGFQIIDNKSSSSHIGYESVIFASMWIASTLIFNRNWASKLRVREVQIISRDALLAGMIGASLGFFLMKWYGLLIPFVVFFYAVVNVLFVFYREPSVFRICYLYYIFCPIAGCIGFLIPLHFLDYLFFK